MRTKLRLVLTLTLAAPLALGGSARAHDDGLTCHAHEARPRSEYSFIFAQVKQESGGSQSLALAVLAHALDNRAAADPDRYDRDEVVASQAALGEFAEMVGVVRSLLDRAGRIEDPVEAEAATRLAEDTLERLPLGRLLTAEDLLDEQTYHGTTTVDFEVLLQYLKDVGTPDSLIAAVEDSAAGC